MEETKIALGGVAATTLAALAAILYLWRKQRPAAEAILAGALVPLGFYTLRFLLIGRGHDGWEWQEAQAALGLPPGGHTLDWFFLCFLVLGIIVWAIRLHPRLRQWLVKLPALAIGGILLLIALQVINNLVFNRCFRDTTIEVPAELDLR